MLATGQKGYASAAIPQSIAVNEDTPMNLAAVAPPPTGGTIVLTTAGTISSREGFVFQGTPAASAFNAHGSPNFPAVVSLSAGNTVTGPGKAMPLRTYTNNAPATFNRAGELTFKIGATLTINANQAPGEYRGTYAVTVHY